MSHNLFLKSNTLSRFSDLSLHLQPSYNSPRDGPYSSFRRLQGLLVSVPGDASGDVDFSSTSCNLLSVLPALVELEEFSLV